METTIRDIATQWTEQPKDKRTNLIRTNIGKLVTKGLVGTGLRDSGRDKVWITDKGMKQFFLSIVFYGYAIKRR